MRKPLENVLASGVAEVAPERPGGGAVFPIRIGFSVFLLTIEMLEKPKQILIFQDLYRYSAAWVPLGSSRGLIFRNPELRKTHFFDKVRKR